MAVRDAYHVYERRGKSCRWRLIGPATTPEKAKAIAEALVASISYPDQQARVKDAATGKWVKNSLVARNQDFVGGLKHGPSGGKSLR